MDKDKVNTETLKDLLENKYVSLDDKGKLQITKEGMKYAEEMLRTDGSARVYMKKVAKYFKQNTPKEESNSVETALKEIDFIESTDLDVYEMYGINRYDDLKNYQLFCKFVEHNPKLDGDATFNLMKEAKYFEIPDNINLLLQNTSNEVRKIRMPHYILFLDFSIVIYDKIFHSALICDLIQIKEKLKNNQDIPEKIDVMSFFSCEEGIGWSKFNLLDEQKDKYNKKLQEYIFNFVDFVNNEDVKFSLMERTEKNEERRIKNGKKPIPSFNKIYVIGYLKEYIDKLQSDELKTRYSHRFWVRGHFRRFFDKNKHKKLYKEYKEGKLKNFEGKKYNLEEGILRVWVFPYIKGEGLLINNGYKLQ
jgi:hypothetical protein